MNIFQGSGYGSKGDWWSPHKSWAEMFKHGPLSGKMSKSNISLEDYKKGIERANKYHYDMMTHAKNKGKFNSKTHYTAPDPSKYRKQINLDFKKMSLGDFMSKYHEAVLPNQPSKIDFKNTLKPLAMNPKRVLGELKPKHAKVLGKAALGQAAKFAGPLAIPFAVYDYLSGSPAGEGSDKPGTKHFDGILKKKKKR